MSFDNTCRPLFIKAKLRPEEEKTGCVVLEWSLRGSVNSCTILT
jgi:hypothetical protein